MYNLTKHSKLSFYEDKSKKNPLVLIYCKTIKIKKIYIYFDSSIFNFTNEYRNAIFQSRFSQKLDLVQKNFVQFFSIYSLEKKKIPSCLFSHVIHAIAHFRISTSFLNRRNHE